MVHERGTQARPDGARMTADVECRYYGRDFTIGEMALLRALIAASPRPNRHALSREFCRRIDWLKPDGGLKDMMARVTMLAMHKDGLIVLPPPKWRRPSRRPMVFGPDTEPPPFPPPTTLHEVRPLSLRHVVRYTHFPSAQPAKDRVIKTGGLPRMLTAIFGCAVQATTIPAAAILAGSSSKWKLAAEKMGWTPPTP